MLQRRSTSCCRGFAEVVLLGFLHVMSTPTLLRALSSPHHNSPTELVACLCSYLVVSLAVKTRFVPPTFPLYIEVLEGARIVQCVL